MDPDGIAQVYIDTALRTSLCPLFPLLFPILQKRHRHRPSLLFPVPLLSILDESLAQPLTPRFQRSLTRSSTEPNLSWDRTAMNEQNPARYGHTRSISVPLPKSSKLSNLSVPSCWRMDGNTDRARGSCNPHWPLDEPLQACTNTNPNSSKAKQNESTKHRAQSTEHRARDKRDAMRSIPICRSSSLWFDSQFQVSEREFEARARLGGCWMSIGLEACIRWREERKERQAGGVPEY